MAYAKPQIANETCYSSRSLKPIVSWVFKELDLDGTRTMVKVKHHNGGHAYQGRFYANPHQCRGYIYDFDLADWKEVGPSVPAHVSHLIVCRISKPGVYPTSTHVYDRKDVPEPWIVEDWREALVSITAHEAYHLRQYLVPKARHGRRHGFSEVDTEWAAYRLWKRWCEEKKPLLTRNSA